MSKGKADQVFEVTNEAGESVIVIARHPKGARTIAGEHLDGVTLKSEARPVAKAYMKRAVNHKPKRS
ncbi:hypothetical protein [Emcibacter sp.]|uniref:hypothetical protein n=1 Tax=Emcibacter sp. TaxID=1979954 RepID=UPI002AA9625B|nr:hypothetical protein [Emcibacter sp.]